MASKDGKDLEAGNRIVYDYGQGSKQFTLLEVTVRPEGSMDEVCLHMTSEEVGERLAAVGYTQQFEVPGW
jgi:hypothetical protein